MSDPDRAAVKSSALDALRNMKFMKRKEEAKRIEILRTTSSTAASMISNSNNNTHNNKSSNTTHQNQQQSSSSSSSATTTNNSTDNNNRMIQMLQSRKSRPKVLSMADLQQLKLKHSSVDPSQARRNFSGYDEDDTSAYNRNNNNSDSSNLNEEDEKFDPNVLFQNPNKDGDDDHDGENNFGNDDVDESERLAIVADQKQKRAEYDKKREANSGNQTWRKTAGKRRQRNENDNDEGEENEDEEDEEDDDEYDPLQVVGGGNNDDDPGAFGLI